MLLCLPRPWMWWIYLVKYEFHFCADSMLCVPRLLPTFLYRKLLEALSEDVFDDPALDFSKYMTCFLVFETKKKYFLLLAGNWQDLRRLPFSLGSRAPCYEIMDAWNMESNKIANQNFNKCMVHKLKPGYNKFPPASCCLAQTLFQKNGAARLLMSCSTWVAACTGCCCRQLQWSSAIAAANCLNLRSLLGRG